LVCNLEPFLCSAWAEVSNGTDRFLPGTSFSLNGFYKQVIGIGLALIGSDALTKIHSHYLEDFTKMQ
ncbi:MAG: hypothetical protein HY754_16015, partial [Nitrospirae bacterium]|nr:hypothetical protein [Nitrospirota bacterium]